MGIDPNTPQYPGSGDDNPGQSVPPQQPYQPPQQPYEPAQPYQPPAQNPYENPQSYQPPQQPYNTPPDSYQQAPPGGGGMGGGQQFTGGSYNPPGGYGAPPPQAPPKKGFNWLMCCGISCGVLLIIGLVFFLVFFKSCSKIIGMGKEMEQVTTAVQSTDITTIMSSATTVDAASVSAAPESYKGQWLAVEGVLSANQSLAQQSGGEGTAYVLEGGLMVTDTSYAPTIAGPGDAVVAYGQVTMMDMSWIPGFQALMDEAVKEDPSLAGIFKDGKMVMFVAKLVEPAGGVDESEGEPAATGWE